MFLWKVRWKKKLVEQVHKYGTLGALAQDGGCLERKTIKNLIEINNVCTKTKVWSFKSHHIHTNV